MNYYNLLSPLNNVFNLSAHSSSSSAPSSQNEKMDSVTKQKSSGKIKVVSAGAAKKLYAKTDDKEHVFLTPKYFFKESEIKKEQEIRKELKEKVTGNEENNLDVGVEKVDDKDRINQRFTLRAKRAAGDLNKKVRELSQEQRFECASGLSRGLRQLHDAGFSHGDLKKENCLIFNADEKSENLKVIKEKKVSLKISDFGKTIRHSEKNQPKASGNMIYDSPENKQSQKADVYSEALVLIGIFEEKYLQENACLLGVKDKDIEASASLRGVERYIIEHKAFPACESHGWAGKCRNLFRRISRQGSLNSSELKAHEKALNEYLNALSEKMKNDPEIKNAKMLIDLLKEMVQSNPKNRPTAKDVESRYETWQKQQMIGAEEEISDIDESEFVDTNVSGLSIEKPKEESILMKKFEASLDSANGIIANIQVNEKNHAKKILKEYEKLNSKLDNPGVASSFKNFQKKMLANKSAYDKQALEHEKLEAELSYMCASYNGIVEKRKNLEENDKGSPEISELKKLEEQMKGKIANCNAHVNNVKLTTNEVSVYKSQVMSYAAVIEKKYELLRQREELEKNPNADIEKIDNELKKMPASQVLEAERKKIESGLNQESFSLRNLEKAKKMNKNNEALAWGSSHLIQALANPANWTTIFSAHIKRSREGRLYVSSLINKPLNITEEGGVPAGLRKHLTTRVTNFYQTTSYIVDDRNKIVDSHTSFRGGQFPTKEAAKAAIKTMIDVLKKEKLPIDSLHINSLLTPTRITAVVPDQKLLKTHKESILEAVKELREAGELPADVDLFLSNFGVNEGAVGEMKMMPGLQMGWTNSLEYSALAVENLGSKVNERLSSLLGSLSFDALGEDASVQELSKKLDHLGAIVEVGQEMRKIWSKGDYANAKAGNNQFKFPALWKVMDSLLGVVPYANCMSGKDRTGKVESNAQEYLDEISMNIADQKRALRETFMMLGSELSDKSLKKEWMEYEKILTSASFSKEDLAGLKRDIEEAKQVQGGVNVQLKIQQFITKKIRSARDDFERNGFLENRLELSEQTSQFPKVGVSSVYRDNFVVKAFESLDVLDANAQQNLIKELDNRQREAVNRRLSQLSGSLQITQVNTGKLGLKLGASEPLARFSSGFDRGYILHKLLFADFNVKDNLENVCLELGLNEFDAETSLEIKKELGLIIKNDILVREEKVALYLEVLKKVEILKMKSLAPQAKVKA